MKYKLSMFNFDLPQNRIAKKPAENREDAKLMVLNRETGDIEHKKMSDFGDYFEENDVVAINNTKVFPARLYAKKEKTGAQIEVFLLRELNQQNRLWDVLVDPARKIRIGNKLFFGENDEVIAEVIDNTTSRGRTLRFLFDGNHEEFKSALTSLGETPLPKHIERKPNAQDAERFQTIFAKYEGAISPPTAGMHFSKILMKKMEIKGVHFPEVTLHVGLGTFKTSDNFVDQLNEKIYEAESISSMLPRTFFGYNYTTITGIAAALGIFMFSISTFMSSDSLPAFNLDKLSAKNINSKIKHQDGLLNLVAEDDTSSDNEEVELPKIHLVGGKK